MGYKDFKEVRLALAGKNYAEMARELGCSSNWLVALSNVGVLPGPDKPYKQKVYYSAQRQLELKKAYAIYKKTLDDKGE